MKKNPFLLSLIFILFACSNKEIYDENIAKIIDNDREPIIVADIYDDYNITPTNLVKPSSDWRNWETITLNSGKSYTVPWCRKSPIMNFGEDIYLDFEPEDGWELLWSTISEKNDEKQNYLIFYNRLSGILRCLFFNEVAQNQNGALWQLNLRGSSNSSLFNACSDHFSYPTKYNNKYFSHTTTNPTEIEVTNLGTAGFGYGWNYFQVELAYDPNQSKNLTLALIPYNTQITKLSLSGSYDSYSEGSLISSSEKDILKGFKNGIATSSGKAGSKWIVNKLKANNKTADILTQGTSAIIKSGVNLVLGSFLGFTQKNQTTTQKLQFTTTGSVTLEGTATKMDFGMVPGFADIPMFVDEGVKESLGLWNLVDDPVIYLKRYLYHNHDGTGPQPPIIGDIPSIPTTDFSFDAVYSVSKPELIINPAILPYIKSKSYEVELIRYTLFEGVQTYICANDYIGTSIPNVEQFTPIYDDGKNKFTKRNTKIKFSCLGCSTGIIDLKSRLAGLYADHAVKVTVKFEMEYQGKEHTFYSTRTYKPKYEWYENKF